MMKRSKTLNIISVLLLMLMAACSAPPEDGDTANTNSPKQNGGAPSQTPVAQNGTPTATSDASSSPASQPAPAQPAAKPSDTQAKPVEKPVAAERAPKLLLPQKKLDFGKQPQDKTLARSFQIKNVGKADLQIESVTPG